MNTTIVIPSTSREAHVPKIFSLNEDLFNQLSENCTDDGSKLMKGLYEDLLSRWAERAKTRKYHKSFLMILVKLFSLHGVPFDCQWKIFTRCSTLAEMHSIYNVTPTQNIGLFFKDISQFENALRWVNWINHQTTKGKGRHIIFLGYHSERAQFMHLVRNQNYRGMANLLSYTHFIRKNNPMVSHNIINISSAFQFAVQCLLAMNYDKNIHLSERIHQLADNCVANLSFSTSSPLLAHLCELLIVSLVFNDLDLSAVLIATEASIQNRKAKYFKHLITWHAYQRLVEYVMYTEGRRDLLFDPLIIADDLFEQLQVFDEAGSVFAEAAIRLYVAIENYDRLYPSVKAYAKAVPRRAKLLADLLNDSNLHDERDLVIQSACQQISNKPHPSEIIWIDWCEMQLDNPRRYGPVEEVYNSCARILFNFLDFGSNRNCDRAWKALHFTLPNVDQQVVNPLWSERSSWWPAFHKRCGGLSEEGQQWKNTIMQALQSELSV